MVRSWTEELVIHPLDQDHTLVGNRGSGGKRGGKRGANERPEFGGANSEKSERRTFLVHARFQLQLGDDADADADNDENDRDGRDGREDGDGSTSPSSRTSLSSALIPQTLDPLTSNLSPASFLDVTYTRGNLGTYRVPSWYLQRGPGLVVRMNAAADAGMFDTHHSRFDNAAGDDVRYRRMLAMISRVVGASASSMMDSKSYVVDEDRDVFVGFLTQDFPCVESVARWLRLMPCGGQAGVGGVMRGLKLLELPYHSVRVVVQGGGERGAGMLTIELSGVVHDAGRGPEVGMMASRNSWMNEARVGAAASRGVLGGLLDGMTACPVVERSVVHAVGCVDAEINAHNDAHNDAEIDADTDIVVDIVTNGLRRRDGEAGNPLVGTLESVIRLDGIGLSRTNVSMRFRQVIPWEVVVDESSLKIEQGGVPLNSTVRWVHPVGRGHAGLLEVEVDVEVVEHEKGNDHEKNDKNVMIGVGVERPILSVHDYPADMSRGIDIPAPEVVVFGSVHAARASTSTPSSVCVASSLPSLPTPTGRHQSVSAVGQNVLFQMPIPDASMPFNVACFTTTLLSLLFGTMMPVMLWGKEDLKKVQSARYGIKARLKRMTVAMVIAGVALFYLDNASRAAMIGVYESLMAFFT